ncbi:unnamed protein product [Arabis nemorensis]|uniref:Uncharacterized protein n=1 Tax=Arabis nemorensis TaxID=586526 RepID=A0A565C441_9BRAS|nr:unnamed protein product [Arabis nemorensis]
MNITGAAGTRILGVSRNAKVADTVEGNNWKIRRIRGIQLQEMMLQIRQAPTPTIAAGCDRVLWRQGPGKYA